MRACALTWDKELTRKQLARAGIPVAPGFWIPDPGPDRFDIPAIEARLREVAGYPAIVKPNEQGSTIGVTLLEEPVGLEEALRKASVFPGGVLVERFIPGHELTVAVFEGRAFPVTEIVADTGFYDYERKYQKGHTRYVTPAEIPADRAGEAARLAEEGYALFGCMGVARVDFRMQPDGALFCLEINTVPGMTELSLVPMGARAAGIGYPYLVERMARSALDRRAGG
jgi:D-alanine-D-alanine ligase